MLDVKLFEMKSFLPMPYEDALAPRLKLAHDKLQNATGAGAEFTGWSICPGIMIKRNSPASRPLPPGFSPIPRPWWSSASAGPIWAPGA